jgi:hypothetical protein
VQDADCEEFGLTKPELEKDCCTPKTQLDFPDTHQCGTVSNGCKGDFAGTIEYGECGSDWVCKDHECNCEAKPVTTSVVEKMQANEYGGGFDFMCPENSVMLGVESTHSDKFEDREWKFSCAQLDAPAQLSGCEKFSFCGKKETDTFTCPESFELVGLSAQPPKDNDRAFEWTCCRVDGAFEEAESGASDMSVEQKTIEFLLEAEPNKPSPMITGVESEYHSGKDDRVYKFSWKSFKTKAHCQTCNQERVTVTKSEDFAAGHKGYLNEFQKDLEFKCPDGEVIQSLKSEYICRGGSWCDLKWNARCGKVEGAKLGSCSKAEPKSCSALSADAEFTPAEATWHLECPRHGVLTEVKSKYEISGTTGDRTFAFTCCELEDVGGYKDYAAGYHMSSEDKKWTFDAGEDTAITGVSSGFMPAKERSFTFYGTTFQGKKECKSEWTNPR